MTSPSSLVPKSGRQPRWIEVTGRNPSLVESHPNHNHWQAPLVSLPRPPRRTGPLRLRVFARFIFFFAETQMRLLRPILGVLHFAGLPTSWAVSSASADRFIHYRLQKWKVQDCNLSITYLSTSVYSKSNEAKIFLKKIKHHLRRIVCKE